LQRFVPVNIRPGVVARDDQQYGENTFYKNFIRNLYALTQHSPQISTSGR
jgi:hypothetical protein